MALKSMTGFGEGTGVVAGVRVRVEISSVNRKQLDVLVGLPRGFGSLEATVQRMVRAAFSRGRISGSVRVEPATPAGRVLPDEAAARSYVKALRRTAKAAGLRDDLGASCLPKIVEMLASADGTISAEAAMPALEKALGKALGASTRMRAAEGRELAKDLRERLATLEELTREIRALAPKVTPAYRERLFRRLKEAGLGDVSGDERVAKEIALFADRCDVTEELTRLKSHLSQMRGRLRSTEPAGRTLDFLCQEAFREINTVGSKANDAGIARAVVAFKTELERIREQVQNVE